MQTRKHVFVSGRVQGVTYRLWTKKQAEKLDLAGWVKNLPDGRVEAVFEGEDRNIRKMVNKLTTGPAFAKVADLEIKNEEPSELNTFEIKYS